MDKLTVRDFDPREKRVFLRVDFNVPLEDGRVTDDSRIRASIPTIYYLLSQGARVVLASHLGRPDGKIQDGLRLRPVGERLSQLLRRNVPTTGDALGPGTEDAVKRLRPGEAILLENLRFHPEEEANDPKFAATLASYADTYVNDAFGTAHRAHASTVGVPKLLPAYAGLLMEREIVALSKLLEDPEHPFVAIVGGAKVSGKLKVLDNLVRKVDRLILGGGMANTFLLAQGRSIGKSLAEHDMVEQARRVLAEAESRGVRVLLPADVIVAKEVTRGTEYKTLPAERIPASWHIVDVGPQTLTLIEGALSDARTVMWNGPIGVFEIPVFGAGTRHVARILADKAEAGATVVVGGGDSVAALQQQGLASKMTHISTGGGASLEFLEGRELPGIAVLLDRPTETPAEPAPPEPAPAEAPKPEVVVSAPKAPKPVVAAAAPKAPAPAPKPAVAKAAPRPAPRAPKPAARPARPAARTPRTPVPTRRRPVARITKPAPPRKATGRPAAKPARAASVRPAKRAPARTAPKTTRAKSKSAKVVSRRPLAKRRPTAAASPPRRSAATAPKRAVARNSTKRATPPKKPIAAKKVAAAKKPASTKKATAAKKPTAAKRPVAKPTTVKKPSSARKATPAKRAAATKKPTTRRKSAATPTKRPSSASASKRPARGRRSKGRA